jgi:UDP-glucose 4-epimerase
MTGSPDEDFRRLNRAATGNLAQAAQHAGVRRFIYLSSLRAQADVSARDVLTEDLPPNPTDAYGRSKLAAEQELSQRDLDWVALRLALVFGPGVQRQCRAPRSISLARPGRCPSERCAQSARCSRSTIWWRGRDRDRDAAGAASSADRRGS